MFTRDPALPLAVSRSNPFLARVCGSFAKAPDQSSAHSRCLANRRSPGTSQKEEHRPCANSDLLPAQIHLPAPRADAQESSLSLLGSTGRGFLPFHSADNFPSGGSRLAFPVALRPLPLGDKQPLERVILEGTVKDSSEMTCHRSRSAQPLPSLATKYTPKISCSIFRRLSTIM